MNKYIIDHFDLGWQCEIEIDYDVAEPYIKDMVEFWYGWEDKVRLHGYDDTFLKLLANQILRIVISYDYNTNGVISELSELEGFIPKWDGTYGIKIIDTDWNPLDDSQFEIKEKYNGNNNE